jgi:hypothetical protein
VSECMRACERERVCVVVVCVCVCVCVTCLFSGWLVVFGFAILKHHRSCTRPPL